MRLTITSDQYDDTLALQGSEFNSALLTVARDVIRVGGLVVVQTEFRNAPPEIRRVFRTLDDLMQWEEEMARVTERARSSRNA